MFTNELKIKFINYRINLLKQRDELGNLRLINALIRERRALGGVI